MAIEELNVTPSPEEVVELIRQFPELREPKVHFYTQHWPQLFPEQAVAAIAKMHELLGVEPVQAESANTEIAKRAEQIYQQRQAKGLPGNAKQDWEQATRELALEKAKKPTMVVPTKQPPKPPTPPPRRK